MQEIESNCVRIDVRTDRGFGVVARSHIHGAATHVIHSCRRRSVGCGIPDNVRARVYTILHTHVGRQCVCARVQGMNRYAIHCIFGSS